MNNRMIHHPSLPKVPFPYPPFIGDTGITMSFEFSNAIVEFLLFKAK
jgi:hypothetical protein